MIMSKVDPKLLARAVVNLKEITLTYTCLTKYYNHYDHHRRNCTPGKDDLRSDKPLSATRTYF